LEEGLKFEVNPPNTRFVAKNHSEHLERARPVATEKVGAKHGGVPGRRQSAILIMGDETDVLRRYARSLSAYGYMVDLATDGESAARLAAEKEFDVVVSDIDRNGTSECESLRRLRERHRRAPMVVLSSGLAFASARAALDCRAHRYLLKPVSDERLLEVLVEAIRDATSGLRSSGR
jgi:DNA-binding NtrC family response regulator